jgi:hypothetical protein
MEVFMKSEPRNIGSHIRSFLCPAVLLIGALSACPSYADTLYWDINSFDPGATSDPSGIATGNWDDTNWTASPDGVDPTDAYVPNSDIIFAAGNRS